MFLSLAICTHLFKFQWYLFQQKNRCVPLKNALSLSACIIFTKYNYFFQLNCPKLINHCNMHSIYSMKNERDLLNLEDFLTLAQP